MQTKVVTQKTRIAERLQGLTWQSGRKFEVVAERTKGLEIKVVERN
jgi:hypothetical protein